MDTSKLTKGTGTEVLAERSVLSKGGQSNAVRSEVKKVVKTGTGKKTKRAAQGH